MNRGGQAELDAAGITDPLLRGDYALCRYLAAAHGRTYFLGTRFLPPARRPAVHALYGFARTADDIVDDPSPSVTVEAKTQGLQAFSAAFADPTSYAPTVRAVRDTAERYQLPADLFPSFLDSMRMDLTVTEYDTFADLEGYVYGSAAVIGLMVTPVLGAVVPIEEALPFAADLGVAFQLTNFIRDVGEDARLGRIYLPQESLRRFGVDRAQLERGVVDDAMRGLLAHEIDRTREIYRRAEPGIAMLQPRAAGCVRVAFTLYSEILTEIERSDYQVFGSRIRVTRRRRAQVASGQLAAGASGAIARRFGRRSAAPTRSTLTGSR